MVEMLPIDSLKVKSTYLRTETNIEKLKKSIETVGLINPLIINENNELIAGGRRYSALKELGFTEVPVLKVYKNDLEQELISIDENLVRKDLTKMEFEKCLNRGREIYEELFPQALKSEEEDLSTPEGLQIHEDLPNDKRSFIDLTAEKTGLSKKVIKSAIDRDAKSSKKVKELRAYGELNASQTNELIKLNEKEQDQVVEIIKDKSAKEVKALVKNIKEKGLDKAVDDVLYAVTLPNEYKSIETLCKRLNKLAGKILLEEMTSEHDDMDKILKSLSSLRSNIDQLIMLNSQPSRSYTAEDDDESDSENLENSHAYMLNSEDNYEDRI
jgi:ParB family chromosome partitioning protein